MQPFGHNRNGPKIGEAVRHLDACSRLATIEMGRKLGRGADAFFGEGTAGSPSNTKSLELRPSSIPSDILIHAAIWPQQIWAENWLGAVPFGAGRAGFPSNTMWPGPSSTCMPSFILIRPTVWPQCTNVTDRQDRTDRTDRQRSDSIGRTILQTVAQKRAKTKLLSTQMIRRSISVE